MEELQWFQERLREGGGVYILADDIVMKVESLEYEERILEVNPKSPRKK